MEVRVPSTLLRTAAVYRSWGPPGQRLGVGFWCATAPYSEHALAPDYWALGLVLTGTARFAGEPLAAGQVYVRSPGVARDFTVAGSGYAECWLDLGGPLAALPAQLGLTDSQRPVFASGIDLSLVRRWDRLLGAVEAAADPDLPLLATEVLTITAELVALSRRRGGDPHAGLVSAACRLLDEGAGQPRLERLARSHGLSYERLRKLFRAHTGCAPGVYRIRRRIDRARTLLRTTAMPVAEVAAAVGSASSATFSLQFKALVGRSPDAWRRADGDQRR